MAAASSGVEWQVIVKPILAASYGSFNKNDIGDLAKAIIKSESEFEKDEEEYEPFYSTFAALCADYISSCAGSLCKTQLDCTGQACRILLKYLLRRLQASSATTPGTKTPTSTLCTKQLLEAIRALCTGEGQYTRQEQLTMTASMKNASLPPYIRTNPGADKESVQANTKETPPKRGGNDLTALILQQLTTPLHICSTSINGGSQQTGSPSGATSTGPAATTTTATTGTSSNANTAACCTSSSTMADVNEPSTPVQASASPNSANNTAGNSPPNNVPICLETQNVFISKNLSSLQALRAGDLLLEMCIQLPNLTRYISKYKDAVSRKAFQLPLNDSGALHVRHSVQQAHHDIQIVHAVMSLPILEPLTTERLEKLNTITMACLFCAITHATASSLLAVTSALSPKSSQAAAAAAAAAAATASTPSKQGAATEEELSAEANAIAVTETALEIFSLVSTTIGNSTRAGGHILQNHKLSGAWLLVMGLQNQLLASNQIQPTEKTSKDEKGKSPSKGRETAGSRINLTKVQHGFGVLSVALAAQALTLMSQLLDDLKLECAYTEETYRLTSTELEAASLDVFGQHTALQRVAKVMTTAPLNQLLFSLASLAFRKATSLKRVQKHPPEGDTFSTSDSTTYYEDDFSCSDESSADDDDSEPIFWLWFEERTPGTESTQAANENSEATTAEAKPSSNNRAGSIVPDKAEPHGYLALATLIFKFMDQYLLGSESSMIQNYVEAGLAEQQMMILASIIRDLDPETSRPDEKSNQGDSVLNNLYAEFSSAVSRYTHNLLARGILSESLQCTLLCHLGVGPWDSGNTWPLQVYPRTLAVLAQVLLLKPQQEKELACINIWHRLINTLVESVCNPGTPSTEHEDEDLNVEHAQLVLFLFHSLNLMQKKSVLLLTAGGVIRCSEVAKRPLKDTELLHIARLLLLLEYIVKHLYDAPSALLAQVRWNLFGNAVSEPPPASDAAAAAAAATAARLYCRWKDIEDNYRKHGPQDDTSSTRPRFYSLAQPETSAQDPPKLDGLACNFILGTPDKLNYYFLLESLIALLGVLNQVDADSPPLGPSGLCAAQYCFAVCWRLLLALPPSGVCMEQLASGEALERSPGRALHALVWSPRAGSRPLADWIKDCLVKQGLYSEEAERMVAQAATGSNHNVQVAIERIDAFIDAAGNKKRAPTLSEILLLDALLSKLQVLLDEEMIQAGETTTDKNHLVIEAAAQVRSHVVELMPCIIRLGEVILEYAKEQILVAANAAADPPGRYTKRDLSAFQNILSLTGATRTKIPPVVSQTSQALQALLPNPVRQQVTRWNQEPVADMPCSSYINDAIPSESYILNVIVSAHVSTLSSRATFSILPSLKYLLYTTTNFIVDHILKLDEGSLIQQRALNLLVPMTMDAITDHIHEVVVHVPLALEKLLGDAESDNRLRHIYASLLKKTYSLMCAFTSAEDAPIALDEKVLAECLTTMETLLDRASGRLALDEFFNQEGDRHLINVLLSVSSPQGIQLQHYGTKVLKFFNKLLATYEKHPNEAALDHICQSFSRLAMIESELLHNWLLHVILGSTAPPTPTAASSELIPASPESNASDANVRLPTSDETQENQQFLQALTSYLVKDNSHFNESVPLTILEALIPIGGRLLAPPHNGSGFSQLMLVMATLAEAGTGRGHVPLFTACMDWLRQAKQALTQVHLVNRLASGQPTPKQSALLDAACNLLSYFGSVVRALGPNTNGSSPWDPEAIASGLGEADLNLLDTEESGIGTTAGAEDDESGGEDSDEDSLCNKLCTFTVTQREFMNQHWYHCHTCKMVDGVGVCTVCARVCHRGHDVTYAKYGNFFCDCGAKEDGSCQALVKRSPQSTDHHLNSGSPGSLTMPSNTGGSSSNQYALDQALRRRASSPLLPNAPSENAERYAKERQRHKILVTQLEGSRDNLAALVQQTGVIPELLGLVAWLVPAVESACQRNSPVGCHSRAQAALARLHSSEKRFEYTDQLMLPTLGSQEGAFENVRMNYSGDQGQTIRQLLSAHMIRRVAMCCLSSPHGRRQHLAVSHEKGKITVLQLSALLKQADSSKRKLTLTRLSSAPIPFTVLSVTSNLWNEDFLAVCGLKDCHVLTFSAAGSVADHLVLHPQLETGNFIIRAIWLPGTQTQLALVTADFVKIYDLAKDALSPQYFFLVPSGKIRDVSFLCADDGTQHLLLMSSAGYIYTQTMDEASSARHGPFYVTNTLELDHPDIKDSNGQVCGGGVSIYYSHALQLLFFSYSLGKSFIAPLQSMTSGPGKPFLINVKASAPAASTSSSTTSTTPNASGNNGNKTSSAPQPLCQWSEVPNHPGLVCSVLQSSNNPVIMMLRPDSLLIQEIKVVPAKAKIMDMVAIRHGSSLSEHRTTLILLCEDGSLRIYMAAMEHAGFWLSPSVQPAPSQSLTKPSRKKRAAKTGKPSGTVSFPIDFFELATPMNDIEFGGNDLLQIYNQQQIKHRLNTTGMYVVSTKLGGFSLEIRNPDVAHVIVGLRVMLGSQDPLRAPSYVEILGRSIPTPCTRNRWFDIPLTREESLQADKRLTVIFGPSQDPENVTIVDSVKVYSKSKDLFGWPEEADETTSSVVPGTSAATTSGPTGSEGEGGALSISPVQVSSLEKMVAGALQALEGCFSLVNSTQVEQSLRIQAVKLTTSLLELPTPTNIELHTKCLLAALCPTRIAYHTYKDATLLKHALRSLAEFRNAADPRDLDAEAFHRLVLTARGVAVARPLNLAKYSDKEIELDETETRVKGEASIEALQQLMQNLMDALWSLHRAMPRNPGLAPVCVPGLRHVEATVHALVDILHALSSCDPAGPTVATAASLYMELLLCSDPIIAFSAKQALVRALRPRVKRRRGPAVISTPPRCSTPTPTPAAPNGSVTQQTSQDSNDGEVASGVSGSYDFEVESVPPMNLLAAARAALSQAASGPNAGGAGSSGAGAAGGVNPIEAMLSAPGAFPPLLDIPPDADDETMVELAIALSLQEHDAGTAELQLLHNELQNLGRSVQLGNIQVLGGAPMAVGGASTSQAAAAAQEAGHFSDTTASAGGSDDEGSTAATDGSTLRTSPAEQPEGGGSGHGSESGGSAADSEHNVSGRSSAYGDTLHEASASGPSASGPGTSSGPPALPPQPPPIDTEVEAETAPSSLHALRLAILEHLTGFIPKLRDAGGVRCIPFMQVILMLTADLDGEDERDRQGLDRLLNKLIAELDMRKPDTNDICARAPRRELHLVIMRLLSVLMVRSKTSSSKSSSTSTDHSAYVAQSVATGLLQAGVIDYCLALLKSLLTYWKSTPCDDAIGPPPGGALLKPHQTQQPPDMAPFFLRQYVKGSAGDVFAAYPQLLTEMAFRLPYQVHKQAESCARVTHAFQQSWYYYLCEYMMQQQAPFIRRQVRKLLLFICNNKDKYRQLRDLHALESHMKSLFEYSYAPVEDSTHLTLPYDSLVELIEHLKACLEVATSRTINWQRFCSRDDEVLPFLVSVSFLIDEGVSPTILQLLQCAICPTAISTTPSSSSRKEREKSTDETDDETQAATLVAQINRHVPKKVLSQFIRTFLLETNATVVRWQAHALILAIYKNSPTAEQESLLDLMWQLWPQLPAYGRKAAQFVDLLGYFSLITHQSCKKMSDYMEQAVGVLRAQNQLLARHPNASLYACLAQYVELDGYFLESEPCLVCNNPEVPLTNIKLSTIKIDSKFTTTTQIVKLVGSHTISKITLRIADLKRTKMVRTINVYYNNRSVQAVVELKNKPSMWHKAKKVTLTAGQTDVKMEFPLPIVACNLMIEYADFYENLQASTETLQCPRCSASVPANPGVCANCGENVFQCHKCRAINYDEKDPFLCHACGFCKYAKFDYTLTGRATCAVDPIENDDDRNKTVATINCLLEKADRVYQQLITNKPTLEMLLLKISEHRLDRTLDESVMSTAQATAATTTSTTAPAQVNRAIQVLAQRYCGECKASFEELSKIIQRVLACRRELVAYDRRQRDVSSTVATTPQASSGSAACAAAAAAAASAAASAPVSAGQCYGCASAATEHCLTLLRPLAFSAESRQLLCNQGLISELLEHNLRKGTLHQQNEVRKLLCLLTRDNPQATEELRSLLMERIRLTLGGHVTGTDLAFSVRHEMDLLAALVALEDSCWEQKLRCVIELFLIANKDSSSPAVMQSIILPCLRILQNLVQPEAPTSKKHRDKSLEALAGLRANEGLRVDLSKWLTGDSKHSFQAWYSRMPHFSSDSKNQTYRRPIRAKYLQEKYILRWRAKVIRGGFLPLRLIDAAWLKQVLFNPCSRGARQVACKMVESLCQVEVRKREIVNLLTGFLSELSKAGESATEFLALYQSLVQTAQWKQYLAVRGVLIDLAQLLTAEIEELHRLEETTLTSDLAQGFALKMLTELLASFLEHDSIKQQYKGRLVGAVLNGYLSLRRLVVQRTRLIDETQEKLLELLEEMTTGTEEETRAFMQICIETVRRLDPQDVRTPVFIFERLCSIIYPEENDVGEFFLTLEKDPQQEDFLQGRMLGNPYSSNEPGLGPLMRDVKNKICQDCELVALLEDDNGMELLVNNKIISLDLPVREVFKKVWLAEGGEGDVMRVVYRMRGLLGDATEEFVETLEAKHAEQLDNEEVYRMANVMADCGGLQVMLDRLSAIQDVSRARPLLQVLLKLFRLCVKVRKNQEVLSQPEVGAISAFLDVLRLCLSTDNTQGAVTEQLLDIMETVLGRAAAQPLDEFERFSQTLGGVEHVCSLLSCTTLPAVRGNQGVLLHLSRVLAALTYTNKSKMTVLCQHFANVTDFNRFDLDHTPEDEHKLELLCVLTAGIERNAIGNSLKDHLVSLGSVHQAIDYITLHSPNVRPALLRADSDEWKEFVARPSLKYVLRFLTGLATSHEPTQLLVSAKCVPVIHRLEQVSSDEHVGSLAENLLEALRAHPGVASRVEEVREQTRAEKKRLAMAMREKQLGSMGMKTNEKGQVTADCTLLMEDIGDETGLVCVICREGYRFQPSKVLGIYTFTKRCNVEEFEARPRKTTGYSTVTHFNVVHVDCHMAAVRLARARDEWESAALQNANTKCNGLLPLWGPQVPESAFASCLARHNTYLQECTGHRDISYTSTIHDLKLLLVRFGFEKPFHEDTGGGGPQSNMHLIPYILHMALYVVNTTRCSSREDRALVSYLETSPGDKWLESAWEAEGPIFWATLSLVVHTPQRWTGHRLTHLSRLLVLAHTRHMLNMGENRLTPALITPCAYESYRPYLIIFGLIDGLYKMHFSKVSVTSDEQWPANLAEFIRHNDESLIKSSEKLLTYYREELIPCTSFVEFCDVAGLLHEISAPEKFIEDLIKSLP